jgi:beta-galactosidase
LRKDFYAGKPAITMNTFGLGKAIYIGTQSHQHFYHDLVTVAAPDRDRPASAAESAGKHRGFHAQKDGARVYFLLNHQNSPVRIQFYKPMHDFLTGTTSSATTTCRRMACWSWTSIRKPNPLA